MTTEVTVKPTTEISTELIDLFSADSGAGMENMGVDDLAIPFIAILQSLSPQCKKSDSKWIKGAEEGMIHNTLTDELTDGDTGILVVPCAYTRVQLQWKPRNAGGGLVARHTLDDPIIKTALENRLPNGNNLEETAEYYVLVLKADGNAERAIVSMSRTQLKAARKFNALIAGLKVKSSAGKVFTPAMYSHMYRLRSIAQENGLGGWYGWSIALEGPIADRDLYQAAKEFSEAVRKGEVKAEIKVEDSSEDVPF